VRSATPLELGCLTRLCSDCCAGSSAPPLHAPRPRESHPDRTEANQLRPLPALRSVVVILRSRIGLRSAGGRAKPRARAVWRPLRYAPHFCHALAARVAPVCGSPAGSALRGDRRPRQMRRTASLGTRAPGGPPSLVPRSALCQLVSSALPAANPTAPPAEHTASTDRSGHASLPFAQACPLRTRPRPPLRVQPTGCLHPRPTHPTAKMGRPWAAWAYKVLALS
jgi:hypothetical protein